MAVPITGTKVSDIHTEVQRAGKTVTSRKDARDNECLSTGYDPVYKSGSADSLKEFRNYVEPPTDTRGLNYQYTITGLGVFPLDGLTPLECKCIKENYDTYGGSAQGITIGWYGAWQVGTEFYDITHPFDPYVYSVSDICIDSSDNVIEHDSTEITVITSIASLPDCADTEAPSVPDGLISSLRCQTTFTLSWNASTDNVGVTGYKVFKNGLTYQDVGDVLTWDITGQVAGTSANWTVSAYDAIPNESSQSSQLNVLQGVNVTTFSQSTNGQSSAGLACGESTITFYLTGGNSTPANGEVVYTNSCGSSLKKGFDLWYSTGTLAYQINNSGVISNVENCA